MDGRDEHIREIRKERSDSSRKRLRSRSRSRDRRDRDQGHRGDEHIREVKRGRVEPSRDRRRSRSRDQRTSRDRSPPRENLGDRLMNLAKQTGPSKDPKRDWKLEDEMRKYREENGIESDSEPTEEEITKQIRLPTWQPDKIKKQGQDLFKEPILTWVSVDPDEKYPSGDDKMESRRDQSYAEWLGEDRVPTWDKERLPKEEVIRSPNWRPPTPPRVNISLIKFSQEFENEEESRRNKPRRPKTYNSKEAVFDDRDLDEEESIVLYDKECIITTTKRALIRKKRELEEEESCGGFGGGEGRGRGGGRGGRGGRGDNPNYAKLGDRNRRQRSQSSSPGSERRSRAGSSRSRDHHERRRSRSPREDRRSSYGGDRRSSIGDRQPGPSNSRDYGPPIRRDAPIKSEDLGRGFGSPFRREERRPSYDDRRPSSSHDDRKISSSHDDRRPLFQMFLVFFL